MELKGRKRMSGGRLFFMIWGIVSVWGCLSEKVDSGAILDISENALRQARSLQEFLQEPEYLPLETVDSGMISGNVAFLLTPDYIWVLDKYANKILVFDRKTGQFIRRVGEVGRGPEEYRYLVDAFYYLPPGKIFCRDYQEALVQYDVSGRFDRKIPLPFFNGSLYNSSITTAYTRLNDTVFCCYYLNAEGIEKKRLILFSPEGKVFRVFPNHNIVPNVGSVHFFPKNALFYPYGRSTFFKEIGVDTVYQVTMDTLLPRYAINCGEYTVSYAKRYHSDGMPVDLIQWGMWETEAYFYYLFKFVAKQNHKEVALNGDYLAVYHKDTGMQDFYKVDRIREKTGKIDFSTGIGRDWLKIKVEGIYSGYLLGQIAAIDIREYFRDTNFPEAWKNVKEDANPVLLMWKLP